MAQGEFLTKLKVIFISRSLFKPIFSPEKIPFKVQEVPQESDIGISWLTVLWTFYSLVKFVNPVYAQERGGQHIMIISAHGISFCEREKTTGFRIARNNKNFNIGDFCNPCR